MAVKGSTINHLEGHGQDFRDLNFFLLSPHSFIEPTCAYCTVGSHVSLTVCPFVT